MKTCKGNNIEVKNGGMDKYCTKEEYELMTQKEKDEIFKQWYKDNIHDPQRKAQGDDVDANSLAVTPWYCRGYCEGFTNAKRVFSKGKQ